MKALIIGAAGFVGKHLIDHLTALNWYIAATRLPCEIIDSGVDQYELDILDAGALKTLLDSVQPDCVFHLAAQSSVALSWKKPSTTVDVNIKGTVNLLEAARTVEAKPKILLIGSGEEYGFVLPTDLPIREDTPLRPGNVYAATKAAQGMLGQIYARAYGMEIVIVRAFNHIGTGQPDTFVVASFCRQVAEIEAGIREPVLYTGDLSARRDITDVRDIVKAYALLALKGKIGVIYNVGSGKAVEIKDVLELIRVKAAVPFGIERDPERLRPSDTPAIEADISRLTSETGWEPEISLETSVTDVLGYWREKIGRAG